MEDIEDLEKMEDTEDMEDMEETGGPGWFRGMEAKVAKIRKRYPQVWNSRLLFPARKYPEPNLEEGMSMEDLRERLVKNHKLERVTSIILQIGRAHV